MLVSLSCRIFSPNGSPHYHVHHTRSTCGQVSEMSIFGCCRFHPVTKRKRPFLTCVPCIIFAYKMLKALGDPYFVAKFQRTFGLREVRSEENGNSLHDFKDPVSELQYGHVVANNGYHRNHAHPRSKLNGHSSGFTREEAPEKLTVPGEQKVKQTYEFNSFFHVIFAFGSTLGYESFYITFFPFLFWNIDEYLARRIVFMWALIMYIGQAAKDVIQWPRPPCPPVISVEKRFQVEYGMPSTHAMVGTLIPVCIVYFTYDRYQVCTHCFIICLFN